MLGNKVINMLLFQAIWFTAAFGQYQAILLLLILLSVMIGLAPRSVIELKVMLMCGGLGIAMDSVLALSGVLVFAQGPEYLPIPLWFMAIWLGFAGTFRHSLNALVAKPLLMTVLAGIAAPLNYLAGVRLGALEFGLPVVTSAIIISISWLVITPMLIKAYRFGVKELESPLSATPSLVGVVEQGRKSL